MRKMTFVVGLGVGYLFGTKAGRARYEQILRSLREAKANPTVQETAGVIQAQAVDLLSTAMDKVGDLLSNTSVGQKINSAVGGGGSGSSSRSGYAGGSNGAVR